MSILLHFITYLSLSFSFSSTPHFSSPSSCSVERYSKWCKVFVGIWEKLTAKELFYLVEKIRLKASSLLPIPNKSHSKVRSRNHIVYIIFMWLCSTFQIDIPPSNISHILFHCGQDRAKIQCEIDSECRQCQRLNQTDYRGGSNEIQRTFTISLCIDNKRKAPSWMTLWVSQMIWKKMDKIFGETERQW